MYDDNYMYLLQVNYGQVGNDYPSHVELPADQMEHVFSLQLATRYYFTVAAKNNHGRGPFSQQSVITTNTTSNNLCFVNSFYLLSSEVLM